MRKSIFDIVTENVDIENDVMRIDAMLCKENTLAVKGFLPHTLKQYVDEYCFSDWKYRNHCLNVSDYFRTLNYNDLKCSAVFNPEKLFALIELAYNFWNLARQDLETQKNGLIWTGNFWHLQDVMDDILAQYNQTAHIDETDNRVLVIEDKPEVTAAAEIVPDMLSLDVIKYNHRSLQGDLDAKKSILISLGSELEPQRKELQTLNKQLTADIFFMLNTMNIRHNNQNEKQASKYKEFVAQMERDQLEKWYDELYQMILLAFLLLDNVSRQKSVADLKSKIGG